MNREQLLRIGAEKSKRRVIKVHVPEWETDFYVRSMTGDERDALDQKMVPNAKQDSVIGVRSGVLASCLCDEGGARIFKDEDAEEIGKWDAAVVDRLFDAATSQIGMTEKDRKTILGN